MIAYQEFALLPAPLLNLRVNLTCLVLPNNILIIMNEPARRTLRITCSLPGGTRQACRPLCQSTHRLEHHIFQKNTSLRLHIRIDIHQLPDNVC